MSFEDEQFIKESQESGILKELIVKTPERTFDFPYDWTHK